MKINRLIKTPTGHIATATGEKNKELEFLSLGDYGKEKNIKASFMGLNNDIDGVPHGDLMPLEKKWVITVSTQYGCSSGCVFCDVPKVGPGVNVTIWDLRNQVLEAIKLHPEVKKTGRLNLHYARMGEPTFNYDVILHAKDVRKDIYPLLGKSLVHPVISTMLPVRNKNLMNFLQQWCELKNHTYDGNAGLQFSINSTSDFQRDFMFNNSALPLKEISIIGEYLPEPKGRKYTLNFALSDDYELDANKLSRYFDPEKFMCKITPLHDTKSCVDFGIKTTGGYSEFQPYKEAEYNLKTAGFDVIIFIPSIEEDQGRITCGNAILSGSMPECEYEILKDKDVEV